MAECWHHERICTSYCVLDKMEVGTKVLMPGSPGVERKPGTVEFIHIEPDNGWIRVLVNGNWFLPRELVFSGE